jgi:ketosteroid isomerase-like protein
MRRVLTLVLLAVAMPARSATVVEVFKSDPPLEVKRLVDAELKFAKLALDTNIRDAFNENMAPDAILFRPTPVNAKEFFKDRPANPGPVLTWYPSYAEISGAGDLGWTTGPWEFRSAKDKKPEAWGHFATVWRRNPHGDFQVLIDEGHSTPSKPPQDSLSWAYLPSREKDVLATDLKTLSNSQKTLEEADAAYSKLLAEKGVAAALAQFADDNVRLLRDDKPEYQGPKDAGKALEHEWDAGVTAWDLKVGAISYTFDLAYTYGIATMGEKAKDAPNGRKVLRVWHRSSSTSDWKLALDVTNPVAPPPAPKKP